MDISKQKRKISILHFLDGCGSIALALGMYGIFVENKEPFLSFLDEPNVSIGLIIVGAIASGLLSLKVWVETKKLKAHQEQLDS